MTGGLHKSEVLVIAGRTSHGKTSLATQIAFNITYDLLEQSLEAQEAVGQVLIFSPEMTIEQLILRQACQISEVPSVLIQSGTASEEQYRAWSTALDAIVQLDPVLYIEAGRSLDVSAIVSVVDARNASGPPVSLVLIDYLQRITVPGKGSAYDRTSHISQELKDLANTADVPILLLSQLNRSVVKRQGSDDPEERMPDLSDLRDSGRIEEDADGVWILWRPVKPERNASDIAQAATLRIAKNRNGPVGVVPLYFHANLTRFEDAGYDRVEIDGGKQS